MKTIFTLILSLCFYISLFSQNLLINGNAELGNISGWTTNSSSIDAVMSANQTNGIVNSQDGAYFFSFSFQFANFTEITLTQEGPISSPLDTLQLSGYFRGKSISNGGNFDFGEVILYHYDSNNLLIDSISTGELLPNSPESWV